MLICFPFFRLKSLFHDFLITTIQELELIHFDQEERTSIQIRNVFTTLLARQLARTRYSPVLTHDENVTCVPVFPSAIYFRGTYGNGGQAQGERITLITRLGVLFIAQY
jgi:hypothetical protein